MATTIDLKLRPAAGPEGAPRWHNVRANIRADTAMCMVTDEEWSAAGILHAMTTGARLESSIDGRKFEVTRLLRVKGVRGTEFWLKAVP